MTNNLDLDDPSFYIVELAPLFYKARELMARQEWNKLQLIADQISAESAKLALACSRLIEVDHAPRT